MTPELTLWNPYPTNESNYSPTPLLREVKTWVMSLNCTQHLQPIQEENASGYKSLNSRVTAQRKEKKEAELFKMKNKTFLLVINSHFYVKFMLFSNIQNSSLQSFKNHL